MDSKIIKQTAYELFGIGAGPEDAKSGKRAAQPAPQPAKPLGPTVPVGWGAVPTPSGWPSPCCCFYRHWPPSSAPGCNPNCCRRCNPPSFGTPC